MRVLWGKAPLLLLRYPPLLGALIALAGLTALVAASAPMLHRGIESGSLQAQLRDLSPLATGLEVRVPGAGVAGDRRRRAAAVRVARDVDGVGTPIVTSMITAPTFLLQRLAYSASASSALRAANAHSCNAIPPSPSG